MNEGMVQAVEELAEGKKNRDFVFLSSNEAIYSGAIGAALWGGFRYYKLKEKGVSL
jgi:hypothetical protein